MSEATIIPLKTFFTEHASAPKEQFLERFDGGFLLVRFQGTPPGAVSLRREEGFQLVVGSDEDVDLAFEMDQTLDEKHATIAYHPGFRGWTIEDHGTSFGTHLDGERVAQGRATLLADKSVIRPGGGILELQFYLAESIWERMNASGITKRLRNKPSEGDG